jgi:hypothetical protein
MARLSPEQQIRRIIAAIRAWEKHAPDSIFSRRTLATFKEAMRPALDAHASVEDLRKQVRIAILERNNTVGKAMQAIYMTGHAVRGDPDHGRDSALNEALGYTGEVTRRTKIRLGARRKRAKQDRKAGPVRNG